MGKAREEEGDWQRIWLIEKYEGSLVDEILSSKTERFAQPSK